MQQTAAASAPMSAARWCPRAARGASTLLATVVVVVFGHGGPAAVDFHQMWHIDDIQAASVASGMAE